jgi:hypothetical protein
MALLQALQSCKPPQGIRVPVDSAKLLAFNMEQTPHFVSVTGQVVPLPARYNYLDQ